MTSIPISDFGGGESAKFEKAGDAYAGTIVSMDERPATDPLTGQVKTFTSGAPMMVRVITLELDNNDYVSLWARGGRFQVGKGKGESMLNAIGTAGREAGAKTIDVGGWLKVAFTGEGVGKPGLNAPKLYTAEYKPPAPGSVSVDVFGGGEEPF
jgi:hypothetical protein